MQFPLHILLIFCIHSYLVSSSKSRIKLKAKTGAYENISVVISKDFSPDKCPHLLESIRVSLSEASKILYSTLNERVHFGTIAIIVPSSWTASDCQTPLGDIYPYSSLEENGDIFVSLDHPLHSDQPWSQNSKGCSAPGDFIYLPHSFLTRNNSSDYEAIVSQWLQFRYGVFSTSESSILSRQYSFCKGRSVSEILIQNPELAPLQKGPKKPFSSPEFSIYSVKAPKYVIVLENSEVMNHGNHWGYIRAATKKFILSDLPDSVKLGLVLFNDGAHIAHTVESLQGSRKAIAQLIETKFKLSQTKGSNVRWGVIKAIESLQTTGSTVGASLIIISQGGHSSLGDMELKELLALSLKHSLQIFSLSLSSTISSLVPLPSLQHDVSLNLETLSHETGGLSFHVSTKDSSSSSFSIYVSLLEAFRVIQSRTMSHGPFLIYEHVYPPTGTEERIESGSFVIDKYIGRDTKFNVLTNNPSSDNNYGYIKSIVIADRRGDIYNVLDEDETYFHSLSVYNVHFHENQNIGMNWTYKLERMSSSRNENYHVVRVTSKTRDFSEPDIKIKFFHNFNSHSFKLSPKEPLKLYADVKLNQVPIMDARVMVGIQVRNQSGLITPLRKFRLFDNGNGDPDIESHDGVYSRYLTDFSGGVGLYSLTLYVDDNGGRAFTVFSSLDPNSCCSSSSLPSLTNVKIGTFLRIVKGDSFRVSFIEGAGRSLDFIPPSRILDARIDVYTESQELEFRWTAPGDDFDAGRPTSYLLYSCENPSHLYERLNETRIVDGFSGKVEGGLSESHRILVSTFDKNLYYALVAIDDAGNVGDVSNILEAFMPSPQLPFLSESSETASQSSRYNFKTNGGGGGLFHGKKAADKALLYIIVGIAGFIIACILVILLIVFSYRRKKERRLESSEGGESEGGKGGIPIGVSTANSSNYILKENSQLFLESTANSSILKPSFNSSSLYGWTGEESRKVPMSPNYQNTPLYAKPLPKKMRSDTITYMGSDLPEPAQLSTQSSSTDSEFVGGLDDMEEEDQDCKMRLLLLSPTSKKEKTKSILKKPKVGAVGELPGEGGSQSSCEQRSSGSSSQVSFSDRDSPPNDEIRSLSPNHHHTYLETSFEAQSKVPPPTFPKPKVLADINSSFDKRIRNITQV